MAQRCLETHVCPFDIWVTRILESIGFARCTNQSFRDNVHKVTREFARISPFAMENQRKCTENLYNGTDLAPTISREYSCS